jgi:hypothetical protein
MDGMGNRADRTPAVGKPLLRVAHEPRELEETDNRSMDVMRTVIETLWRSFNNELHPVHVSAHAPQMYEWLPLPWAAAG